MLVYLALVIFKVLDNFEAFLLKVVRRNAPILKWLSNCCLIFSPCQNHSGGEITIPVKLR